MTLERFCIEDEARRQRLRDALWVLVWAVENGQGIEAALMRARLRLEE
jgi:hypothetical protein